MEAVNKSGLERQRWTHGVQRVGEAEVDTWGSEGWSDRDTWVQRVGETEMDLWGSEGWRGRDGHMGFSGFGGSWNYYTSINLCKRTECPTLRVSDHAKCEVWVVATQCSSSKWNKHNMVRKEAYSGEEAHGEEGVRKYVILYFLIVKKDLFSFLTMFMSVQLHVGTWMRVSQRPETSAAPGAGAPGGCELPYTGAGNETHIFWKSNRCFQQSNHLSIPSAKYWFKNKIPIKIIE